MAHEMSISMQSIALQVLNVTGNQLSEAAIAQFSQQSYQLISDYQYGTEDWPDYEDEDEEEEEYRFTRHTALYE